MWWRLPWDIAAANLEAQRVIALRVMKFAEGGRPAQKEAQKMVNEKVLASVEAAATLAGGGSPEKVVSRYRTIMRNNVKRLNKPKRRRRS
jgi:hypothetical protein